MVSPPLVMGRLVFVANRAGEVFALHRSSGRARWSRVLGSPVLHPIALGRRELFVTTRDGRLLCLEARSGRIRWVQRWRRHFVSGPMVDDLQVLVSTDDGRLTALDTRSGLYRWQHVTPSVWRPWRRGGRTLAGVVGTPAVAGDTIYFGSLGGWVYALVARTGALRWRLDLGYPVQRSPAVTTRGLRVADGSGYLHELSLLNGDRMGRGVRSWYDRAISEPALGPDTIYLATRTALLALASSGRIRWRYGASDARGTSRASRHLRALRRGAPSAPVLARDVVYSSDLLGQLMALDARTGKLLWRRRASRGLFTAPTPVMEGLVVGVGDGRVLLLSPRGAGG